MKRFYWRYAILLIMVGVCLTTLLQGEANALRPEKWRKKNRQNQERVEPPSPPPLSPESFARSLNASGTEGSVLYLELDQGLYSGFVRDDFKDLCVFDASGTPVPFMLVYPEERNDSLTESLSDIGIFPWRSAGTPARPAEHRRAPLPGKTDIEIDTEGGIIKIRTQHEERALPPVEDGPDSRPAPPDTLLLDMRKALGSSHAPEGFSPEERRSVTLWLEPADSAGFMARVQVLTSDDLERWDSYGYSQHLARITQGDEKIDKLAVSLPVNCPRYVLLRFYGEAPGISYINGEAAYSRRVVTLKESSFAGRLSEDRKSVLYHVPGVYPLWAVNLELPRPDIMTARFEARSAHSPRWRDIAGGAFYRLEKDGVSIRNDPLRAAWPGSGDWRLASAGDIPFTEAPSIKLFWKPHTLYFLARGQGPWTVACGREFPVNTPPLPANVLDTAQKARIVSIPADSPVIPAVQLESTDAPADRNGTDRALLWAALALTVVFLSGIAFFLMRAMKKQ